MKIMVVVALLVGSAFQGASTAWDRCPPIDGCHFHQKGAFEGDVTLAAFPCSPNCGATGTPNEAAPLVFTTDVALGIHAGGSVGVANSLTARVFYSEPACVAGEALTGSARGTATINGTNVVGTVLPVTVGFVWQRVGLVAVITSDPVAHIPPVVGAALFIPTGGAPNCTGGPLTATIAGVFST